jgi:hypothetical protein
METMTIINDVIDLMIDARKNDLEYDDEEGDELHDAKFVHYITLKKRGLDVSEVITQAVIMFAASYKTTGTTL